MQPLWQLDQEAFRAVHVGLRRDWLDPFMVALSLSGLGYVQAAALLLAAFERRLPRATVIVLALAIGVATVFVEKTPSGFWAALLVCLFALFIERPVALCALASVVVSGIVRLAVVPTVGRQRPSNLSFATPMEPVFGHTSFPSGHATTTFAIATVLCWSYARTESAWIAWTAGAWAVLVGLSRVYVGVHYPLDVVGAAGLGIAVGSVATLFWRSRGWAGPSLTPGRHPSPETAHSGAA